MTATISAPQVPNRRKYVSPKRNRSRCARPNTLRIGHVSTPNTTIENNRIASSGATSRAVRSVRSLAISPQIVQLWVVLSLKSSGSGWHSRS